MRGHRELEDPQSGVVKINLALGELPDFIADPGTELAEHHTGSVEMAPSMEYIERAFQDAREGRPALRPFSRRCDPDDLRQTLCPEGIHNMSLFTQWVPSDWNEEPHQEELEAYADRMIDCYNELAPNLKGAIFASRCRRAVRDGARVRSDRGQHLPRGAVVGAALPHEARTGLRGLPDADLQVSTTGARRPTAAAGCADPGLAGGEGRARRP